ncbi:orotidine-5'-phosphate decarboxylase [Pseudokineococcus basanitobsidens]|uniref:Orotidine 5'-phosphate decarboxylase n=1 Tax=Pseudokineococcus basanitobsidens TaxID=1926649 RepID=A0ABU8RI97_9ACTN
MPPEPPERDDLGDLPAAALFGDRLRAAMDAHGPLAVGVDPHPALLAAWGLPDDPSGLERFALAAVEALAGAVAAVKPQSAFFERHGSRGVAVLERVLATLADAGTLSVLDVKRGDVGSTMTAYAQAHLADGAPLAADAVTLSPYLGLGALRPALDLAAQTRRGAFVLALTSNPEGPQVQHARGGDGRAVAAEVARGVAVENADAVADGRLGSVGLVVGATTGGAAEELGLDLAATGAPLLAPGLGAQGAAPQDLARVFGPARRQVLATSTRAVLQAGPDVAAVRAAARDLAERCAFALSG